jgi:hypothetical protein
MNAPNEMCDEARQDWQRLHAVLEAAQDFLACRDKALGFAPWGERPPIRTLADAIQRDVSGLEVERAEHALRDALTALCRGTSPEAFPGASPAQGSRGIIAPIYSAAVKTSAVPSRRRPARQRASLPRSA